MTSPKEKPKGIDIPQGCPAHTPVRTGDSVDLGGGKCCPAGKICALGTIDIPDGETLIEVRAIVYHSDPGPDPAMPDAGYVSYDPPTPPGDEFTFDHNLDNEIPDVLCGPEDSPQKDNWLVIWARLLNKKKEYTVTDQVRVCGVCDSQTECQQS